MSKTILIGIDGTVACDSKKTREQIEVAKKFKLNLFDPISQTQISGWEVFDDPNEHRTLFMSIELDRKQRVDEKTLMADRPNFAALTVKNDEVVRVEYYEGHDALELVHDLRAESLQKVDMPKYLDSDPNAYNPIEFLEGFFGQKMPAGFKEFLAKAHKKEPL